MVYPRSNLSVYSIEDYNPEWVSMFEELRVMLKAIFGNTALAIEHIGSTSIPGMKAKPLIDVLVVVEKIDSFTKEKEDLKSKGYELKENYIAVNTLLFTKTVNGVKTENIHICGKDSLKTEQFLMMRDYLREHPHRAQAYSEVKERLKSEFPDNYPAYRAGKKEFLDETERLAEDWKDTV